MHIISGDYRGRKINTIKDKDLRPTTAQTREAVFNIITHHDELPAFTDSNLTFLEVFCGTAIMSFEAMSRGAKKVILIDRNPRLKPLFEENATFLEEKETHFFIHDVAKLPKALYKANLCFIDPPYQANLETNTLDSLHQGEWLEEGATVILETDKRNEFSIPSNYKVVIEKKYGKSKLLFLQYSQTLQQA